MRQAESVPHWPAIRRVGDVVWSEHVRLVFGNGPNMRRLYWLVLRLEPGKKPHVRPYRMAPYRVVR